MEAAFLGLHPSAAESLEKRDEVNPKGGVALGEGVLGLEDGPVRNERIRLVGETMVMDLGGHVPRPAGLVRRRHQAQVPGNLKAILNKSVLHWNVFISEAVWLMGLAQIPFIINFCFSWKYGRKVSDNPWDATTLEWSAPSPPPHGNFPTPVVAYRGPYEYSVPGHPTDFTPQSEPPSSNKSVHISGPPPEEERSIGFPPLT